ncbi:MAG: DUF748 domain-containing protein, partial [Gammaproteobacteria bacterium]
AETWLTKQGLEASIGYISIRPVLGSVQINDVQVRAPNGEQLLVDELHVNIAWRPLSDQWLLIEDLVLDTLAIDLVQGPGILRIGGIPIATGGDPETAVEEEATSSDGGIARISIEFLSLNNLDICYSRVDAENQPLANQCAYLGGLTHTGDLDLELGEEGTLLVPGVQLQALRWYDRLQPLSLLAIDSVSVGNLVSPDMRLWKMGALSVQNVLLLPETDNALQLDSLELKQLSASDNIIVDQLLLGELSAQLQLNQEGLLTFAPAVMERVSALAGDTDKDKPEAESDKSASVALRQFSLNHVYVGADRPLLEVSDVTLQGLGLQGAEVSLDELKLANFELLPRAEESALALMQLTLAGLSAGENIVLNSISLGDARVHLQTLDSGELAFAPTLMAQLVPASEADAAAIDAEVEASPSPQKTFSLGSLSTSQLRVMAEQELLSIDVLALNNLTTGAEAIGLESFQLDGLAFMSPASQMEGVDHYVQVPLVSLRGFSKTQSVLGLEHLEIKNPDIFVHRDSDGQLVMLKQLNRFIGKAAGENSEEVPESASSGQGGQGPVQLRMGEILIGQQGQVRVLDESVSPALSQQFSNLGLAVQHLDATRPDKGATLNFNLGVNRFGYLKLAGDLAPFGEHLNTKVDGELNGVDVRDLSGYAGKYIGYHLDHGSVDADIDVAVREDEIDAEITTRFHELKVSPLNKDQLPEGAEELGVPLEFALSLLRDNDGTIELKLPIGGNINSPEFSLSKIINKVLFKVIAETVVNYYLPFGLLAKSLIGDSLANLSFQPVPFTPGLAALSDPAHESLNKIAAMLQARQQLHLVFCAPSTRQDWMSVYAPDGLKNTDKAEQKDADKNVQEEAVDPEPVITPEQVAAMALLADQRTEAAKAYLVDAGVKPGQMILCTGAFEKALDKPPEMAISIGQ